MKPLLLVGVLIILTGCATGPSFQPTGEHRDDLTALLQHPALANRDLAQRTHLLLVTYNEGSCASCLNRELKILRDFLQDGQNLEAVYVVANTSGALAFEETVRQHVKTRLVASSMLWQHELGDFPISKRFRMALISLATNDTVLEYYPKFRHEFGPHFIEALRRETTR